MRRRGKLIVKRHLLYAILSVAASLMLVSAGFSADAPSGPPADWKPSPTQAIFRSLLIPGWGQSYDGHPLKAVVYGGIHSGLLYGIYRQNQLMVDAEKAGDKPLRESFRSDRARLTWLLAGAVIMSMVDAYVDAYLYKFEVSDDLASSTFGRVGPFVITWGWQLK